jgi:hypothetical protein
MVIVHSYVKVYQRVVSSWGLKANGFLRLANGHDGAMAVVEPDPYQWMRSQLLALTGIMFVKVLELLFCYLYLLSRLREREINHAKVNFRLHAMLPGIRRATNRLSLAKMSWFQFSDSLSKYIPSKSPVSYSISTFQVPRPTCSPQVTMPKSQVDKDIGVAIFLNASVVARDPC